MDQLTKQQLAELVDQEGDCLVSLYMPMHRAGREVQQNRIRFKNQISQAQEKVEASNCQSEAVMNQLKQLEAWEADDDRWQHQSDGLAVFLDGSQVKSWRLPAAFKSVCHVADHFYMRPLCRLLQEDSRFYLLATHKDHVKLYSGSQWGLDEVTDADLPENLRAALNLDEYVSTLQYHSSGAGDKAMFHGQGGSDPDNEKQDEIKQYYHHVDSALTPYLNKNPLPLLFAGVDYLFPIFKSTCSYNDLQEEWIKGSPEQMSPDDLHSEAWSILSKRFDTERGQLLEQLGNAIAKDLGSEDVSEICTAAEQGRVQTLLIGQATQLGAHMDEETTELAKQINEAVVATLRHGGDVYSIEEDCIDSPMAAIMRYPAATPASST